MLGAQGYAAMERRLLIVYHSTTGGTAQMARAAAHAATAAEPGLAVRMQRAADTTAADLLVADGYLFATPEMLAALAGAMKDLFDRCYYPLLGRIEGRPYASLVCAGSDGSQAARQLERIATGWRLRAVAPALIVCTQAQTPEAIAAPKRIAAADLERCAELGATIASGLALGVY